MPNNRIDRIGEEIKKELSSVIMELKDPRMTGMVSVMSAKVTNDLRFCKAYISVLGDEQQQSDVLSALKSAAGFIRKEIGHRVQLRYTPEFSFVLDNSIEKAVYLSKLIDETITKDKALHQEETQE